MDYVINFWALRAISAHLNVIAKHPWAKVALYLVETRPVLVKFEQASNGPKCTCTVVAVYPVTFAYHARDSTCHAHSLAFVKFKVPFLPIDPFFLPLSSFGTFWGGISFQPPLTG